MRLLAHPPTLWATLFLTLSSVVVLALAGSAATASHPSSTPTTLFSKTLVSGPPAGATGPDDLTQMAVAGLDDGTPLIWTEFQNGIDPNGTPGTAGGPNQSTVVGYDPVTGAAEDMVNVTGHVDGLTAWPSMGVIIATSNEDNNSFLSLIDPVGNTVTYYHYSLNPSVNGNGGTDSIAIDHGVIYLSHSNPNDTTQATVYAAALDDATHTAILSPVFWDDSLAQSALGGGAFRMALTDPDTNYVMPHAGERFAGDLATISQGDGKIIFAAHPDNNLELTVLNLTDNVSGNLPPIDGIAVATASEGTLYVVDAKANTITAMLTDGFPAGTIFVTEPSDNGNPLLGVLNPWTGNITSLGNHFVSPKGILFVPEQGHHQGGNGGGNDNGQGDENGQGNQGNADGQGGDNGNGWAFGLNWWSFLFGRW